MATQGYLATKNTHTHVEIHGTIPVTGWSVWLKQQLILQGVCESYKYRVYEQDGEWLRV